MYGIMRTIEGGSRVRISQWNLPDFSIATHPLFISRTSPGEYGKCWHALSRNALQHFSSVIIGFNLMREKSDFLGAIPRARAYKWRIYSINLTTKLNYINHINQSQYNVISKIKNGPFVRKKRGPDGCLGHNGIAVIRAKNDLKWTDVNGKSKRERETNCHVREDMFTLILPIHINSLQIAFSFLFI